jgi:hypothetical protein
MPHSVLPSDTAVGFQVTRQPRNLPAERLHEQRRKAFRRLVFEALEQRRLLSGLPAELDTLLARQMPSSWSAAENPAADQRGLPDAAAYVSWLAAVGQDDVPEGLRRVELGPAELSPEVLGLLGGNSLPILVADIQPDDPRLQLESSEVLFLSSAPPPQFLNLNHPFNKDAADTTNTDQLYSDLPGGLGLTGAGLTVGIWDIGHVLSTHREFQIAGVGSRVTYGDQGTAVGDHATQVAGTLAAKGVTAAARGMASEVDIRSYDSSFDTYELDRDAALIQVSNHSYGERTGWDVVQPSDFSFMPSGLTGEYDVWWGNRSSGTEADGFGKYTHDARDLDRVLQENPRVLSVWAAGNDRNDIFGNKHGTNEYVSYLSTDPGNVSGWSQPGWYLVPSSGATLAPDVDGDGELGYDTLAAVQNAKNSLVVGAVNSIVSDPYTDGEVQVTGFSSYGPTDDGRVKPDVVGDGELLTTTDSDSNDDYATESGTSYAAPNVAGTALLLTEHYQNVFASLPTAATTKGLLIHTAYDKGDAGPDYAYGWGLVDGKAAADFLTAAGGATPTVVLEEATYRGTELVYQVEAAGTGAIKATIVWTDPAGEIHASTVGGSVDDTTSVLVHDLDLTVTSSTSDTTLPWKLDPANPSAPATRGVNHVDNVEQVLVEGPASGVYRITISSTASFTQGFTLLVSGAKLAPDASVVGVSGQTLVYRPGDGAQFLDASATLADADSADFNGGNLTVRFTPAGTAAETLSIAHEGTGAGQIGVSGSQVSYGGTAIGTFSGGNGTTPLVINFTNTSATSAAVQSLLRRITYAHAAATRTTPERFVTFSLEDGDGGISVPVARAVEFAGYDLLAKLSDIEGISIDGNAYNLEGSYYYAPSAHGAAGPSHVVSVVNSSIQWHRKDGTLEGNQPLGQDAEGAITRSFFETLTPVGDLTGAKVVYDQAAGRFVVTAVEETAEDSRILVAVSDDSDPNGAWYRHAIDSKLLVSETDHYAADLGLATDEEAVYITANMWEFSNGSFGGSRLWILAKGVGSGGFYEGGAASPTPFDPSTAAGLPGPAQYLTPAQVLGTMNGSTGTFLVSSNWSVGAIEYLSIIRVDNPLGTPSFTSSFLSLGDIANGSLPDAPQAETTVLIDTGGKGVQNAVWRDSTLWLTNTINPTSGPDAGQATAHWYKINTANLSTLTLADQGNVGGEEIAANTHTFFPSITVDAQGNMAIGFAASGSAIHPGAYYTGRLSADLAGTVRASDVLAAGEDYFERGVTSNVSAWGSSSATAVDPVDGTVWVFNPYALLRGSGLSNDGRPNLAAEDGRWGTRWGNFSFGYTISIASADATASETATDNGTFTLTLADGKLAPTGGIIVNYAVSGTAAPTTDYAVLAGSVTIEAGDNSATIDVTGIVDDAIVEGNETVIVTLTVANLDSVAVAASPNNSATVTITDNDAAAVTVENVSAVEGVGLVFTVTLDKAVAGGTAVNVTLTDVTATGGAAPLMTPEDYDNVVAALVFAGTAGETKQFTVTTLDDTVVEGTETFTVSLDAVNALVTDSDTATGTITDNDTAAVTVENVSAASGWCSP